MGCQELALSPPASLWRMLGQVRGSGSDSSGRLPSIQTDEDSGLSADAGPLLADISALLPSQGLGPDSGSVGGLSWAGTISVNHRKLRMRIRSPGLCPGGLLRSPKAGLASGPQPLGRGKGPSSCCLLEGWTLCPE